MLNNIYIYLVTQFPYLSNMYDESTEMGDVDFEPLADILYKVLKPTLIFGGSIATMIFIIMTAIYSVKAKMADDETEKKRHITKIIWNAVFLVIFFTASIIGFTLKSIMISAVGGS